MTPASCSACQDSLPRYLCFRATLTASGTGSGTDIPCCSVVSGRLLPVNGTDCGWSSLNIQCSDGSGSVGTVTVTIERGPTGTGTGTGTGCWTHVSVLNEDVYFDGVLPSGMTFTIIKLGIKYECEVFSANMVPNPAAFGKCPLCSCVTCIPEFLCIKVTRGDNTATGIATWDCQSNAWLSSPISIAATGTGTGTDGVTVGLRLASKDDGVGCAIIGTADGAGESGSFIIDLEPTTESPGSKGFVCHEGSGAVTRGRPPFDSHIITTVVNHSVSIGPSTGTGAANSFQISITDRACGQSCNDGCSDTVLTACCEFTPIPKVLYGTWNYNTGGVCPCEVTSEFHYTTTSYPIEGCSSLSVWTSNVSMCGMEFTAYLACCTLPGGFTQWMMYADNATHILCPPPNMVGGPYFGIFSGASCDPLVLEFLWSWTGNCCPDGSLASIMTCQVTL